MNNIWSREILLLLSLISLVHLKSSKEIRRVSTFPSSNLRTRPRRPPMQLRRVRPVQPAKILLTKSLNRLKELTRPAPDNRPHISKLKPGKNRSQDKQLVLGLSRPVLRPPFRLNPAAFLIPAIPTLIGNH